MSTAWKQFSLIWGFPATQGIDALLDYGERLTRTAIDSMPDGEYVHGLA